MKHLPQQHLLCFTNSSLSSPGNSLIHSAPPCKCATAHNTHCPCMSGGSCTTQHKHFATATREASHRHHVSAAAPAASRLVQSHSECAAAAAVHVLQRQPLLPLLPSLLSPAQPLINPALALQVMMMQAHRGRGGCAHSWRKGQAGQGPHVNARVLLLLQLLYLKLLLLLMRSDTAGRSAARGGR